MSIFNTDVLNTAISSTLVIIVIVPIIGLVQNFILKFLMNVLARIIGVKLTMFLLTYATFIGVCLHESAHAVFAWITGGKVNKIVFFNPQNDGTLGYVVWTPQGNFIMQSLQSSLTSMAPTVVGIIAISLLYMLGLPKATATWQIVLIWYAIISIGIHLDMSTADLKGYISGLPICAIIVFVVCLITKFDSLGHIKEVITRITGKN